MSKFKIDISFYILIITLLLSPFQSYFLYLFLILLIHEAGHIFFIILFKIDIKLLKLYAFGFFLDIDNHNCRFYQDLIIYFGGILFNLISLLILPYDFHTYIYVIVIINLLPIYPLDGFMIIKSVLSFIFSYSISLWISSILSLLSLLILSLFMVKYLDGFLIFNLICLLVINIKEFKMINQVLQAFYLRRYLDPPILKKRKMHMYCNSERGIFKYRLGYLKIGNRNVDESELLRLKYEGN